MKYVIILLSIGFLFSCGETTTSEIENLSTKENTQTSSENIATQVEHDFTQELNMLLNTIEETPNE